MSLFKDWFDQPKRPRVADLQRNAIDKIDRFDREDFNAIDRQMKAFRLGRHELEDFTDTGGPLWEDNFYLFLKAEPHVRSRGEMRPSHLVNYEVAEQFPELAEYERLRIWTQGDVVSSAMGCAAMKDDLLALYDRANRRREEDDGDIDGCHPGRSIEKGMDEYDFTEEGVRTMEEMIEAWKNMEDQPSPELQAAMDEAIDQAHQDLNVMADTLEAKMDKLEDDIKGVVKGSIGALRADMASEAQWNEDLAEAAAGWGVEPGVVQQMDYAQRAALAERLIQNPKVKKLTEMIGAMTRTALEAQSRKVYYLPEEVVDVTVGVDLDRLLPEELLAFCDPDLELDFFHRYTEETLLQYKMRGQEKLSKGGIVYLMDNSGSMAGEKEMWAKGAGLGMLAIARQQRRPFYGCHFSSKSQLKCFDFRDPKDITLDRVLMYAEHMWNGGTDFEAPLNKAVSIFAEEFEVTGAVEGDVVLATDGMCGVSPEFMSRFKAEQERMGFRVYGLAIGCSRKSEPLWTIADGLVVTITDLLSGEEVRDLFRAL